MRKPTTALRGITTILLFALVSLAPSATAELEGGELSYDLVDLETLSFEGSIQATGDDTSRLREQADRDDDGVVDPQEATEFEEYLKNEGNQWLRMVSLDGKPPRAKDVSLSTTGLQGPVSESGTIHLNIHITGEMVPDPSREHVFEIGSSSDMDMGSARFSVLIPQGTRLVDVQGGEQVGECAVEGTVTQEHGASVTFTESEPECLRKGSPTPGTWAILAVLSLVASAIRRPT